MALVKLLDHVEKWISHGYVTRNQAVSWLRQIMMIIYGVVRRANEDFQMDERDIGDVMESRRFPQLIGDSQSYTCPLPFVYRYFKVATADS